VMAFTTRHGIELQGYTGPVLTATRGYTPLPGRPSPPPLIPPAPPLTARTLKYQDPTGLVKQFDDAVEMGRILPVDDQSAFTFLQALRARLKLDEYRAEAEKLRVALEDRGQQVLLTYLAGEQTPQKREDFFRGTLYFEAAQLVAPDSLYLQSRLTFCLGRVAIFDKDYDRAGTLLERAVGLDPERAYAYNALGIAYLERADYDRAILAFRDAAKRAPYWAYPLHNMALSFVEKGDYDSAIRTYREAMRLAPGAAYLPYNLGLVYQRTNQPRDADAMYRAALRISPDNPQTFNALGYLRASRGKKAEAENFYRQALAKDPELLVARHNLAVLLSETPNRSAEAIALWRENLAKMPAFVPSRLSLARLLSRSGQDAAAANEYAALIQIKPDYLAARLALADLDVRLDKGGEALVQLQEAAKLQPTNAEIYEKIGDIFKAAGRSVEAVAEYRKAIGNSADGAVRKRINRKIKGIA
jgi:Flp pilus assembly protein TadD